MTKSERDKLRLLNRTPEKKAADDIAARARAAAHHIATKAEPHMAKGNPWQKLTAVLRVFALSSMQEVPESNAFDLPVNNTQKK